LFSAFGKLSVEPLFLRGRRLLIRLGLLVSAAWILWLPARAAADVASDTQGSKSYKIVFKGNSAISEAALRRDAAKEL